MYRIKLPSGNEATYPTLEAFAAGVRAGAVTPDSQIHHARADKWIPVNMHPHFKLALDGNGHGSPARAAGLPSGRVPAIPSATGKVPPTPAASGKVPAIPSTTGKVPAIPSTTGKVPAIPFTTGKVPAISSTPGKVPAISSAPGNVPTVQSGTTAMPRLSMTKPVTPATTAPRAVTPPKNLGQVDVEEVDRLLDLLETRSGDSPAITSQTPRLSGPAPRVSNPVPAVPRVSVPEATVPKSEAPKVVESDLEVLPPEPMVGTRIVRPSQSVEALRISKAMEAAKAEPPAPLHPEPKTVESTPTASAARIPVLVGPPVPMAVVAPIAEPKVVEVPEPEHFHREEELEIPAPSMLVPVEQTQPEIAAVRPRPSSHARAVPTPRAGSRRPMGLIAAAAAALLAITVSLVAWRPWATHTSATGDTATASPLVATTPTAPPQRTSMATPTPGSGAHPAAPTGKKDSVSTQGPASPPTASTPHETIPSAPEILPAAPKLDLKGAVGDVKVAPELPKFDPSAGSPPAVSPALLVSHYTSAYTAAASDLNESLDQSGLSGLFAQNRISSASGVENGRRTLGLATAAIRQYRTRTSAIERAYQDTLLQAQRNHRSSPEELRVWAARASQQEGKETAELVDLMLGQAENVFDLLSAQEGRYSLSGEGIKFSDAEVARRYGTLRVWLAQKSDSWTQTPEGALPVTLRQVLKAVSKPGLPQEK